MSHVTHAEEACHSYGWVKSHMWISNVVHMDESRHTCTNASGRTYKSVMSYIWMSHVTRARMSHVTHRNKSCNIAWRHTYEWVMSHIWMSHVTRARMSHVTHRNQSCDIAWRSLYLCVIIFKTFSSWLVYIHIHSVVTHPHIIVIISHIWLIWEGVICIHIHSVRDSCISTSAALQQRLCDIHRDRVGVSLSWCWG